MKARNGIVLIYVLSLAFFFALPVIAADPETNQEPPLPGHLVFPPPEPPEPDLNRTEFYRHETPSTLALNQEIVDMIEQVDENLMLAFLEELVGFGPRVTGSPAVQQAGQYIYDTFESMGLDVRFDPWSYYGYSGNNVEATLPGLMGGNNYYVVCAHYDSVSGSPGADDNASGTAAVMALAAVMSNYTFSKTIKFVAFDGEEQGLLGSHEYVKEAYNNGDNIGAALNADMIGFAISQYDLTHIKIYEDTASEWLTDFTDNVCQTYNTYLDLSVIPSGYSWGSDHASFWDYGYHAIFYHEYNFNDYYHSPQDTIDKMNMFYQVKCTKLIMATMAELTGVIKPLPLHASKYAFSTREADSIEFDLDAGTANAGRSYVLLASASGTSPGMSLPGGLTTLPLNWDDVTWLVYKGLNTPFFTDFMGTLDVNGQASAQFNTYGPLPSTASDLTVHFAYTCLSPFDYVSNATTIWTVD